MMRDTDAIIAKVAAAQHGVATRAQLLAAGVAGRTLDRLVAKRRLLRVHQGVYRVGPVFAPRAREMAAVLACGKGAAVSHWSAGEMLGFMMRAGDTAPVDVTTPEGSGRRRPGIRIHRTSRLDPSDVTTVEGVRVTAPLRTLRDLAGELPTLELEQAVARALRSGVVTSGELRKLIAANATCRGIRKLMRLVEPVDGPALSRSEAEARFLSLVRSARLPAPATNVRVQGYEVDFIWRPERLVVEVDGYAFHASRATFAADRRRDADLTAAGYRVMRVTWDQMENDRDATLVRLAQALAHARQG